MPTKTVHVRIPKDELEAIEKLAKDCGITASMLAALLLRAAQKALKKTHGRLTLPVEMELVLPPKH